MRWYLLAAALTILVSLGSTQADDVPPAPKPPPLPRQLLELNTKTMGGQQFWTDVVIHHSWRIQENVITGHCRLLDEHDKRHASGTHAKCVQRLEEIKRELKLPELCGEIVMVVHGLGSHRSVLEGMGDYIERQSGYTALYFGYASTRAGIEAHASQLGRVIDNLGEDVERVHFVAHSLGNLVVRQYLTKLPAHEGRRVRIGRFVMLAPPNQGAAMARLFKDSPLFNLVIAGTGKQLASDNLDKLLGTPPCDFGIIAGGKSDGAGWNPVLKGDDDLIVRVDETALAGAKGHILLRVRHKAMLKDKTAREQTLHFLKHGQFKACAPQ